MKLAVAMLQAAIRLAVRNLVTQLIVCRPDVAVSLVSKPAVGW